MEKQSDNQEEDVEKSEHGIAIVGEADNRLGYALRYLLFGEKLTQQRRGRHQ